MTAVDIGGTWTRVGRFPDPGRAAFDLVARFPTSPSYADQIAALAGYDLTGPVGVSITGRTDPAGRTVAVSLNLPDYVGRPMADDLSALCGGPVRLAHDATCGLLGEARHGVLHGVDRCGYVTLSTGTGSAIRLGAGRHFVVLTTEAGHQLVGGEVRCACGQTGCLDTRTGGRALQRRLGRALESVDDPGFWTDYGHTLALGLANLALSTGVEVVALGGSIALRREEIWSPLRDSLRSLLSYCPLRVVAAALGADAPLVGAAALHSVPADSVLP